MPLYVYSRYTLRLKVKIWKPGMWHCGLASFLWSDLLQAFTVRLSLSGVVTKDIGSGLRMLYICRIQCYYVFALGIRMITCFPPYFCQEWFATNKIIIITGSHRAHKVAYLKHEALPNRETTSAHHEPIRSYRCSCVKIARFEEIGRMLIA
jgi:hypothetical protein